MLSTTIFGNTMKLIKLFSTTTIASAVLATSAFANIADDASNDWSALSSVSATFANVADEASDTFANVADEASDTFANVADEASDYFASV